MLQIIAVYLLKVLICSALLLTYYWAALRNKRFHYYNRFYLLLAVALSFTVPLLNLQWFSLISNNTQAITLLNVMYGKGEEDVTLSSKGFQLNWQDMVSIASLAITVFFLLVLTFRILKIYQIKRSFPVSKTDEFDFINTDIEQAPFSFLKNIFWRSDISLDEKTGQQILRHELAHIKQKHTWDKLFMQIVLAIFWMNPFYWLIQRELYLIHEFIADEKAVEDKDASAFAAMLLHAHYGKFMFAPAQSFFYSPIKRRLLMLTTSKKPSHSYVRRLMALPLLIFVVCLFAFRLHEDKATVSITKANAPFKLVVDAGHGGKDNGAVGVNGILEKDINLAVSKKIKQLSGDYKIDVVLTRDEDKYMSPQEKVQFAESQNANAFISMHVNATEPGKTKATDLGMEVFVSKENDHFGESKLLGSAVLQSLKNNFEVATYLSESKTGIWVLKANTLPAILVELGYIDNNNDAANLTNDKKIEQMARKILEGIALYANHSSEEIKELDVKKETALAADTTIPEKNTGKPIAGNLPDGPLYIVDGKMVSKSEADRINPKDIKSVNVLKGESAAAAYGDKGKNGVVEITTKNKEDYKLSYNAALNPPKFPGGKDGWLKYLQKNLNANVPVDNGAVIGEYKVVVSFTVDKDGTVSDVKAENDPGFGTAGEAVRLIKTGPQWLPATEKDIKIKAKTKQEITFSVSAG
ncbi:MAG TPA: N-acetylmuramoyl-L-alanine amidase [Panacibacter sp.]|nr:N-acetylmuramoyl-L-alanine amidase [Panacibacter sp.]